MGRLMCCPYWDLLATEFKTWGVPNTCLYNTPLNVENLFGNRIFLQHLWDMCQLMFLPNHMLRHGLGDRSFKQQVILDWLYTRGSGEVRQEREKLIKGELMRTLQFWATAAESCWVCWETKQNRPQTMQNTPAKGEPGDIQPLTPQPGDVESGLPGAKAE